MKWFQHMTDSHTNGKMRIIIRKHGMKGYGFYWLINEIIAKEGEKFKIKPEKEWKIIVKEMSLLEDKEIEEILQFFGGIKAICAKALGKDELYNPKLKERADDYTKRRRRVSEHPSDNVPLQYNTRQYITKQYITTKGWEKDGLTKDDYARINKNINALWGRVAGQGDEATKAAIICKVISWVANKDYIDWTLETVLKKWPEAIKNIKKEESLKKMERAMQNA